MDYKKIGEFLKSLRKANGFTQEEVADQLMVSAKTISRWECGDGLPDINIISAVADLYKVTVDEILKGEKASFDEGLKEETINIKNKNKDKLLVRSVLKTNNVFFLISIIFSLTILLTGIIVAYFNILVGLIINVVGAVIALFIYGIGTIFTKEKINDNDDLIDKELNKQIKNKLLFRLLFVIDVTCANFLVISAELCCLITTYHLLKDIAVTLMIFTLCYLILRLPLINKKEIKFNKYSIISVIIINLITIFAFGMITYARIYEEPIYYGFVSLLYPEINDKFDLHFYGYIGIILLIVSIILALITLKNKKTNLLWISLVLAIVSSFSFYNVECRNTLNAHYIYKIIFELNYPSVTGILAIVSLVLFTLKYKKIYKIEK